MYTNCTLHKSIRDPYYDLRENNLVCTSPIRDVKAFLHHSACCYNPLGTRNPSCFCYLLLHICTYLPTGTVSKSNNVSKSGGKSLHASPDLFFGFRNSLPEKYVPRSANLNDPTTQLSSHHHTTNPPRVLSHCGMKYRKIVSFMNFFVKLISRNFFVKSISRNFS